MEDSLCQVLINNGLGSSLALQLDFNTHTAVFVNQIKKALHQFCKKGSNHNYHLEEDFSKFNFSFISLCDL